MATRIVEEINKIVDEKERLIKFKNQRKVIKTQLTNVNKQVYLGSSTNNITNNEALTRLENVNVLNTKFEMIQDHIDMLTTEDCMDAELIYREEMVENFIDLKVKLKNILSVDKGLDLKSDSPTNNSSNNFTTSNLTFMPYDEREHFANFTKRLNVFMALKGITDKHIRTLTFLHALSPLIHQKLGDLCAPDEPTSKSYEDLVNILQNYLDPQASVLALQHKFIIREQVNGESITDFSTDLKRLSVNCNFNCSCGKSVCDIFLRLQFIRGLTDPEIRTRILQEREVKPFTAIVETATAIELSKTENAMISKQPTRGQTVYQVNPKRAEYRSQVKKTYENNRIDYMNKPSMNFDSLRGKCYRCGSESHRANACKFVNEFCHTCDKVGHIAKVCQSRFKVKTQKPIHYAKEEYREEDEEGKLHEIHIMSDLKNNDKFNVVVTVEDRDIVFELDTGASLSSISLKQFNSLFPGKKLFSTGVELRTYTGEVVKPKGVAFVQCKYKCQLFVGKLYVINHQVDAIFGREWMREVKLDWADIRTINETHGSRLTALLKEYNDIFKPEIGEIPDLKAKFELKENTAPIYIKPRQVPYAIKEKVEKELERLEKERIITRVVNSQWGTPVVPVIKPNGNIRLCADFKITLNKVVKDVNYPIPRIEDIFSTMSGGRYFCTLDVSNAYLHMVMDNESAEMQTLSTHKGLFKVNRLMFGVKTAPSMWQRFMDSVLQGTDGVQCFFDDIIIQGSTFDETFERLRKVLELLKSKNLRLNREKSKFFEKSIKYLGHTIDEKGLHKNKDKVEAIQNAKRPTNINELRSFLGLVTYYSKFITKFSDIVNPLNRLLQKNKTFEWTEQCERSYKKVKEEITNERTLAHFDPSLPLVLATDASPVGLGAVLSHRMSDGTEKPIAFASRTLTQSEQKYSQIDKEATAIYWGLKKFFPYCYGRKFILITDHKPLVSIFDPHRTLPTMAATRIFNYAHFLSGFNYTVEFRRTEKHCNADFLSRFPVEQAPEKQLDDSCIYQLQQLQVMPVSPEDISRESLQDDSIKTVIQLLKEGKSLEKCGLHDYEYTIQDECLFKGNRIVIPYSLQSRILQELHVGHLGIVKMKSLARSYCYWKGIDRDIENLTKTCKQCCMKQNKPCPIFLHPWEEPQQPWQRIHIDFAGPCLGNNYYFIVVDAFTKWVEVMQTKTTTSEWCIKTLRKLFSTFGFPSVLVSDNGPQFTSYIFKNFLDSSGTSHKTCAPFHPASNGQAERYVQTVKKGLTALEDEKGYMEVKLQYFLMQLRKARNSTGKNSYELMFGRNIRTWLDLMLPTTKITTLENMNYRNPTRYFNIGERVQALNHSKSGGKWSFGKVTSREGRVIYLLEMDNGCIWRRHINQLLPCNFKGED